MYFVMNTLLWTCLLFPIAVLKIAIPFRTSRRFLNKVAVRIAGCWVFVNSLGLQVTGKMKFEVEGDDTLKENEWYLVMSNHQSWADIPILQKVLYKKTPFLKFFLKKELIWVPILGAAWWALDFPFMKRYSRDELLKNPALKNKDIEITQKACEKSKDTPVSLMTFVEATRFTQEKKERTGALYENLLRPKAGSVGFIMQTMGDRLDNILDITIYYPEGVQELWGFLCGKVRTVKVKIDRIPITEDLVGNYSNDTQYKKKLQHWLNQRWAKKDEIIKQYRSS